MKTVGNVTYWRDQDIDGMEVCRVVDSRHEFPNHVHDDIYAFGLMESGGSWCLGRSNDNALVLAGEVALINPGQVHSGVPLDTGRITYTMIYIDMDRICESAGDICQNNGVIPEFTQTVVKNRTLFDILLQLSRIMGSKGSRLQKQTKAVEAAAALVSGYGGLSVGGTISAPRRRAVRLAKEFLAEELDRKMSLDEVASAVGISRYHFLRVFKEQTGLSPHAFRTQRRIGAAQRLLKKGVPLSQVALATGFSDQSHFTNRFRQYIGATPRQYISG